MHPGRRHCSIYPRRRTRGAGWVCAASIALPPPLSAAAPHVEGRQVRAPRSAAPAARDRCDMWRLRGRCCCRLAPPPLPPPPPARAATPCVPCSAHAGPRRACPRQGWVMATRANATVPRLPQTPHQLHAPCASCFFARRMRWSYSWPVRPAVARAPVRHPRPSPSKASEKLQGVDWGGARPSASCSVVVLRRRSDGNRCLVHGVRVRRGRAGRAAARAGGTRVPRTDCEHRPSAAVRRGAAETRGVCWRDATRRGPGRGSAASTAGCLRGGGHTAWQRQGTGADITVDCHQD
jgi:hypothetical protein